MLLIQPVECGTTATRNSLVAWCGFVSAEVGATYPLQGISSYRCEIPYLRRGGFQDGCRQDRVRLPDEGVQSDVVQLGEGAYPDHPVRQLFDAFETGNPRDVHELGRFYDTNASPVEEFSSPGENHGIRGRGELDRLMNGSRPCIAEVLHQAFLLATALTAATIWDMQSICRCFRSSILGFRHS